MLSGLKSLFGFGGSASAAPKPADEPLPTAPVRTTFVSTDEPLATLSVLTKKSGVLTSLGFGHNLQLSFEKFVVHFTDKGDVAGIVCDLTSAKVAASLDADLHDRIGNVSERDQKQILGNTMSPAVLDVAKFPRTVFTPVEVVDGKRVTGDLELHGVKHSVTCEKVLSPAPCASKLLTKQLAHAYLAPTEHSNVEWFKCLLHTPDFGIEPYSAAGGLLSLEPDVIVWASVPTVVSPAPGSSAAFHPSATAVAPEPTENTSVWASSSSPSSAISTDFVAPPIVGDSATWAASRK
jgi:hypothetical protein